MNEQLEELRSACRAAERYIVKEYARQLWNEHASYDLEKARYEAEANPPEIVLLLRSALGQVPE